MIASVCVCFYAYRFLVKMSASDSTLKLRVIIGPTSTRKVVLPSRPETVSDILLHSKNKPQCEL